MSPLVARRMQCAIPAYRTGPVSFSIPAFLASHGLLFLPYLKHAKKGYFPVDSFDGFIRRKPSDLGIIAGSDD